MTPTRKPAGKSIRNPPHRPAAKPAPATVPAQGVPPSLDPTPGVSPTGDGGPRVPRPRPIWTLGTSNRTIEQFLECLRGPGIRHVVDARRFPTSERFPHFAREPLEAAVRAAGCEYHGFGDRLGGFRSGGYARFQETPAFLAGLGALEALAAEAPACLVCAERLPWRCHRLEIAKVLEGRGWRVVHVLEAGKAWEPKAIAAAAAAGAPAGPPVSAKVRAIAARVRQLRLLR